MLWWLHPRSGDALSLISAARPHSCTRTHARGLSVLPERAKAGRHRLSWGTFAFSCTEGTLSCASVPASGVSVCLSEGVMQ